MSTKLSNSFHSPLFAAFVSMTFLISFLNQPAIANAAQLVEVTDFGTNPSGTKMFEYVPDKVAPFPALLVLLHGCGGSAQKFYKDSKFAQFADHYGFIVVYPDAAGSKTKCWDVWSTKGLQRDGGSDSQGIVSMVQYEIRNRGVNPLQVNLAGFSSGAMIANVLMAEYPDVFQAGSVFAGVPYGCFLTTDPSTWYAPIHNACSDGQVIQSAQEWGDLARKANPDLFIGIRPRVQLFHGTRDTTLYFAVLGEEVKQWTNVMGLSSTPTSTDEPDVSSYGQGVKCTRERYGGIGNHSLLEVNILHNADHGLIRKSVLEDMSARFLGLIP